MFRSKKFNKDFEIVDEKKRYKLYKSGKNWVKASNSQLDLFRIGGMGEVVSSTLSDTEELDHAHLSFNTLAGIGGILAAGAAGFVMTQEQTVYADETSDYAEKDKTVIAAEPKAAETTETSTNSIIAQAQAEVKKAQTEQASATASVSVSQSVEAQASASQSASVSQSASASQSVLASQSASASASTSAGQSTAPASESASQSTSAPVSASASAKASASVSSAPSESASAQAPASVVESTSAVSEPSAQASVSTSASASLNLKVNPAASLVSGSANQSLASAALSASQAVTTSNNIAAGIVADKNQAQGKDTTKQAEKDQTADKQVTNAPKEAGYSGFRSAGYSGFRRLPQPGDEGFDWAPRLQVIDGPGNVVLQPGQKFNFTVTIHHRNSTNQFVHPAKLTLIDNYRRIKPNGDWITYKFTSSGPDVKMRVYGTVPENPQSLTYFAALQNEGTNQRRFPIRGFSMTIDGNGSISKSTSASQSVSSSQRASASASLSAHQSHSASVSASISASQSASSSA
ncbi:KxYKxGKxW signal peptide containing protein, partial [Streptococcus sp. NLAE-zl-C503]|uniref:KxYKxGKxW signal peptide domain-containing protein n=1 Tax=Streptococcus sp. NLAE-zl-C503 TaxID=1855327 RepID=UPI00088121D3